METPPHYIEVVFAVNPLQPGCEILIAQLAEIGFDTFVETPAGVEAYILKEAFEEKKLLEMQLFSNPEFTLTYAFKEIEQVNWNKEWEKNFTPIQIGEECMVRAPFHPPKTVDYEIVIEPKMSFGTGHHATTHMMVQYILQENWEGKNMLDMGCGTGVLAILAAKKGASSVTAIDIDHWCYLNTLENIERNHCPEIKVNKGGATYIQEVYDVILANINRNILLEDMPVYVQHLRPKGELVLSGFYREDLNLIQKKAESLGLEYQSHLERDNWMAAKFVLNG